MFSAQARRPSRFYDVFHALPSHPFPGARCALRRLLQLHRRHVARNASPDGTDPEGGRQSRSSADSGTERQLQADRRARSPQALRRSSGAIRGPELRFRARRPDRSGAVRTVRGGLDGIRRLPGGPPRRDGRRHVVPRRDRHPGRAPAGQAARDDRNAAVQEHRLGRIQGIPRTRRGRRPRKTRGTGAFRRLPRRPVPRPEPHHPGDPEARGLPRGHPGIRPPVRAPDPERGPVRGRRSRGVEASPLAGQRAPAAPRRRQDLHAMRSRTRRRDRSRAVPGSPSRLDVPERGGRRSDHVGDRRRPRGLRRQRRGGRPAARHRPRNRRMASPVPRSAHEDGPGHVRRGRAADRRVAVPPGSRPPGQGSRRARSPPPFPGGEEGPLRDPGAPGRLPPQRLRLAERRSDRELHRSAARRRAGRRPAEAERPDVRQVDRATDAPGPFHRPRHGQRDPPARDRAQEPGDGARRLHGARQHALLARRIRIVPSGDRSRLPDSVVVVGGQHPSRHDAHRPRPAGRLAGPRSSSATTPAWNPRSRAWRPSETNPATRSARRSPCRAAAGSIP